MRFRFRLVREAAFVLLLLAPVVAAQPSATPPPVRDIPWVQPSPGGRYFILEDGRPFVPIGHQAGTGFMDLTDEEIAAHFARMREYGENVVRLDLDYFMPGADRRSASYLGLEQRVGVLDPARVARVDAVFRLAAAQGIRILVVPWLTSPPLWPSWPLNPYSNVQGGPAANPYDFMTSTRAREDFGRRLERISERWGGQGTLFAWDLMNESNVLLEWENIYDPAGLQRWVAEMGSRVARHEQRAFGRAHPRMVSWSTSIPKAGYEFLLTSPALDVACTHPYDLYGTSVQYWPNVRTSVVRPAIQMHEKIRSMLGRELKDRRPYLENERFQNSLTTMSAFCREAEHDMAWAELASGAAGTGIPWIVLEPVSIAPRSVARAPSAELLRERHAKFGPDRRALRTFIDERVPASFFTSATKDEALDALRTSDRAVAALSVRRGPYAIAWLVGTDERNVKVEAVDEVRSEVARGEPPHLFELCLAVVLWRELLKGEGVAMDDRHFEDLLEAMQARDEDRARREALIALAYLEGLELRHGTLAALRAAPTLSPAVEFKLPAGVYAIDWVDDRDARILRSDRLKGGANATLRAPTFTRHLAVVVRPAAVPARHDIAPAAPGTERARGGRLRPAERDPHRDRQAGEGRARARGPRPRPRGVPRRTGGDPARRAGG